MHPRTVTHIAAVRVHYGATLAMVTDQSIAKLVFRVPTPDRAIEQVKALLNSTAPQPVESRPAPVAKPVIRNISTDAVLERVIELPKSMARTAEVDDIRFVELYVDDPAIGCGFHRFLVLEEGVRTVKLFNAPKLAVVEVARRDFDKRHRPARGFKRQTLIDIIRRNVAFADKINDREMRARPSDRLNDGGAAAQQALRLLEKRK